MTRVLHVIDTTGPGGAETVFLELAAGLPASDWDSLAALPGEGWLADALRRRGVDPVFTPVRRTTVDLRYLLRLVRLIRERRIDLIQTHLLGPATYAGLAGALCGVPVVSTFHGHRDLEDGRWRGVRARILRRAAALVFVSHALQDAFAARDLGRGRRMRIIENGIPADFAGGDGDDGLRGELGIPADAVLVGAVGNVRPPKAYDVLLAAAAALRREHPRVRFLVVGDRGGPLYQRLVAQRDALGLADVVQFTGFRTDVARVMRALDVFLITSRAEGFSLATVEAMACGVPVVATRCGGPEEIVTDGVEGILVPVDQPDAIAGAVAQLAAQPERRRALGAAGRRSAAARFGLERMRDRYTALYRECLDHGGAS